jgi:transglutaminase-like putative cysteine protease
MRLGRLTPLSLCHLAFYSLIALYLCAFHPSSETMVLILFLTGVIAEILPRLLRSLFLPELLLVSVTGLCWWLLVPPHNQDAMHGTAGIAIAYWLLVPSRLGMLRWVLSLVIVELLLMSRLSNSGLSTLIAVPIGLAALGMDSWLSGVIPARASARLKTQIANSIVRWAIVPVCFVVLFALTLGSWAIKEVSHYHATHKAITSQGNKFGSVVVGLEESLSIGNHSSVDRDPRIAARLTWESGVDPIGLVYLRALALSQLHVDGSTLSWKPNSNLPLKPAPSATHQPTRWARILRMPSRTDVVLRPDGGDAIDLDGLVVDGDHNRYRPLLGEGLRSYRVDFDDGQLEADPDTLAQYRTVDVALSDLPWQDIEGARWRNVSPERAATLIRDRLQERCHYDLENLPAPAPGPGGVLRGFLFGRSEAERRGHCQYFSTAAVILLRRAGHTARCVAGFASDEYDDRGVVFRGLHAHAWIEVVNAEGRWQRFDPTPGVRNARITAGIDLGNNSTNQIKEPLPQDLPPVNEKNSTSLKTYAANWWPLIVMAVASLLYVVVIMVRKYRNQIPRDPRLAELQRRNDDLVRLAMTLGVMVKPATTLSDVATALEQRTGIDLRRHLEAHLAARFGNGPLPEPWPIDTLRQAARVKSNEPKHAPR